MAVPSTTYISQRAHQTELAPDFARHGFSYQHTIHSAHPQAPIPVGQTASSTLQTQNLASQPDLLSHPYVQTLERQLDNALRKATILHQATLSRHFLSSLRTQHGIICPDCKQEVVHSCSTLNTSTTFSSLQTPLGRYEYQPPSTLSNPSGLRAHVFGEHVAGRSASNPFESSVCHVQPPLPTIPSLPPAPVPRPTVSSSGAISSDPPLCVPGSSSAIHSQYNSCNDSSRLGKRDLHRADLECEPKRKRTRSTQQRDFHPSQALATSGPSSFEDSCPPFPTISSTFDGIATSVPGSPATTSEDDIAKEPESDVGNWSITYNSEVEREVEVSMLRPLETAPKVGCLKFSKDGRYLAVGFSHNATTNIYDVQTAEKTCTLREYSYYEKKDEDRTISITAVCFSPNSLYLATGGVFDVVRIWEISKRHVRNVLKSPEVDCINFSPDGRLIALSSSESGILEIRNWRDGSRIFFQELDNRIDDSRFSPEGKHIAAGMDNGDVLIWNVRTGQLVVKLIWPVTCFAFMPDGTGLVGGGSDAGEFLDIRFFGSRLQDGRLQVTDSIADEVDIREEEYGFFTVAVSSNSRWLISCSYHGDIQILNAQSTDLHCVLSPRIGMELPVFTFSPDRGLVAITSRERSQVSLCRFREISDSQ